MPPCGTQPMDSDAIDAVADLIVGKQLEERRCQDVLFIAARKASNTSTQAPNRVVGDDDIIRRAPGLDGGRSRYQLGVVGAAFEVVVVDDSLDAAALTTMPLEPSGITRHGGLTVMVWLSRIKVRYLGSLTHATALDDHRVHVVGVALQNPVGAREAGRGVRSRPWA